MSVLTLYFTYTYVQSIRILQLILQKSEPPKATEYDVSLDIVSSNILQASYQTFISYSHSLIYLVSRV